MINDEGKGWAHSRQSARLIMGLTLTLQAAILSLLLVL